MKFAKELEKELVPEWRAKYLDYKLGKKKLKAVARAVRNANRTPRSFRNANPSPMESATSYFTGGRARQAQDNTQYASPRSSLAPPELYLPKQRGGKRSGSSTPSRTDFTLNPELEPLFGNGQHNARKIEPRLTRYGSILGSPPSGPSRPATQRPPPLELPGPAIGAAGGSKEEGHGSDRQEEETGESAYEAGKTKSPAADRSTFPFHRGSMFGPKKVSFQPGTERSRLRRLLSIGGNGGTPSPGSVDYPMDAYREIEARQSEFFGFMDSELHKIDSFYKQKEEEATERLRVLRVQLHVLRDQRLEEIVKSRPNADGQSGEGHDGTNESNGGNKNSWIAAVDHALSAAFNGRVGKNTAALGSMTTPDRLRAREDDRDYVRRPTDTHVPYRSAKRKLKIAVQEYYRALELLKSYALLNRIAFRKLSKKYDKNLNARPTGRYMSEKVNKAWFVESDVLDGHISTVEDLYARYFEGGNRKLAAGKLKKTLNKKGYYGGAMFRNGLFIAAGLVFGVQGIVAAGQILRDRPSSVIALQTSYLLQIYAGYLFMLLLALFFCLACQFWTKSKVNYVFIFEFDTRHYLDWRQLGEIPCFFLFLLGFFLWINFSLYGTDDMYIYYPVVLIVTTGLVLFFPGPIIYWRSRIWFLYTTWRLFWSGLYPIEFRDFFLGDLFCSTAYSMGNIELFFCLYAQSWSNPVKCNSSNSRLLGFFTTVPGIWRALQCLRRYRDTHNAFPHLANCGKYTFTILYYMSLSLYRMNKIHQLRAFFIFCATINSIYCSIWDLVMDWSLLDPTAKPILLRDMRAYKQTWLYYLAMCVDPVLRFNWIFYAVYANDVQHSALLSFFVSLSEVLRRGLWVLIRVENEHCANVCRFRASRDVPLPFDVADSQSPSGLEGGYHAAATPQPQGEAPERPSATAPGTPGTLASHLTSVTTGSQHPQATASLRRRRADASPLVRGLSRVGSMLHTAHAQDFERKRKPGDHGAGDADDDSSDEDGEDGAETPPSQDGDDGRSSGEAARTGERAGPETGRERGGS